jgi:hypothetical protein
LIEGIAVRLPLDKVYRAFPELDRFSDATCTRFVRQAVRRNRLSQAWHALLGLVLAALVVMVWYVLGAVVGNTTGPRYWDDGPAMLVAIVYGFAGPAAAMVSVLMLRDSWLRRMIARQLVDTRCPNCRYSLLGLEIVDGRIHCPECGNVRVLAETELTAADFVAPAAPASQDHRAEGLA